MLGARIDYAADSDAVDKLSDDPISNLLHWLEEASMAGSSEPNAMTLSTVGAEGKPSSRVVLARAIDSQGITFFTSYESKKSCDISTNNSVALNFYWPEIVRQVRVEGEAHQVDPRESDAYFSTRPRDSQLAACLNLQSKVITSRAELEHRFGELDSKTAGEVRRPEHWGGFRVLPHYFEFWVGRAGRLHDRTVFEVGPAGWVRSRLGP